jgi:hypothetical protein
VGANRNSYNILIVKHEGKRTLGRYRGTWEDNTKVNIKEMEWACSDCIHVRKDRVNRGSVVKAVMIHQVSYNGKPFRRN